MTTFRLPDGAETEIDNDRALMPFATAWVEHPTLGLIAIARDRLTEVKPPLPPVPDALAVAVGDHVFVRDDIGAMPVFICPGACHPHPLDWPELNDLVIAQGKPIIPLKPDPADDAPALPWETIDNDGDRLQIRAINGVVEVAVTHGGRWQGVNVTAAVASGAGMALLRAAREVETP